MPEWYSPAPGEFDRSMALFESMRQLISIGFICVMVFAWTETVASQADAGSINIALDKSTFDRAEPVRLRVTITNNTARTLKTHAIPVSLYLTKRGTTLRERIPILAA